MQIWTADFSFELTTGHQFHVRDVVTKRIPLEHIHLHSEIMERATRAMSITEAKLLAKDKAGRHKVRVQFKKKIGTTNNPDTFFYA